MRPVRRASRVAERAAVVTALIGSLLWAPHSAAAQVPGPPLKPASLVVSDVGNGQVTLRWVAGGDGGSPLIGWQYRASSDGIFDTESWTGVPGGDTRSYTVRSLTNEQQHSFQVRALNDFDDDATTENPGVASDTVTATPSATSKTAPERPRLLASGSDAAVDLRYVLFDNGGAAIRQWQYRQSTDAGAEKTWSTPTRISSTALRGSHRATALTNATEYFFAVRAANDFDGNGALDWSMWSETASATPNPPVALSGATVTGAAVVGTFEQALDATSVPSVDHFTVTVNGQVVTISSVAVAASAVTLTLAEAVRATAQVTLSYTPGEPALLGANGAPALALAGRTVTNQTANSTPALTSPPSALKIAENSPPGTAVLVSADDTAVQFAGTDADGDAVTFSLRDTDAGSGHAAAFSIDPSTGHLTVAEGSMLDHEALASYGVTVAATDGIDTATHEAIISVDDESPPDAPRLQVQGLMLVKPIGGALRLAWQPPTSDGGTPVIAYKVYWYKTSDISGGMLAASKINSVEVAPQAGALSYVIAGLSDGTEYGVSVTAVNREGESGFPLDVTGTSTQPTLPYTGDITDHAHLMPNQFGVLEAGDFRANTQPRNVAVTTPASPSSASLVVTWDAPSNVTANTPQFYRVRWSSTTSLPDIESDDDMMCSTACAQINPTATRSHTITSLTPGQKYWVVVEYFFKETPGSETTLRAAEFGSATALGEPSAPTEIGTAPGDRSLLLQWKAPARAGGLALDRYEVRWGPAGGAKGTPVDAGLATEYTVTGLSNEQEYEVEVRAVNGGSDSTGTVRSYQSDWAVGSGTPNGPPETGSVSAWTRLNMPVTLPLGSFPFADDGGDSLAELIIAEAPPAAQGRLHAGGANLVAGSRVARSILDGAMPLTFVPARDFLGTAAFAFRLADGEEAESGTGRAEVQVLNAAEHPSVVRLSLVSDAGEDRTYIAGDEVLARVAFTSAVKVTGVPQLVLQLGDSAPINRTAVYRSGSGTPNLIFGYTVVAGDNAADGIGVGANAVAGTIHSATAGGDGTFAAAGLATAAVAADPDHKVDTAPPLPSQTLRVSGASVTVSFNEPLAKTEPEAAAFAVTVGAGEAVPAVRVGDSEVTLELAAAVSAGQQVTVSYTAASAGTGALRDVGGNPAADFVATGAASAGGGSFGGGSFESDPVENDRPVPEHRRVLVLADGWNPADAGIATALAAQIDDAAVLYFSADSLDDASWQALAELDPAQVLVVGGAGVVSSAVLASVERVAGVAPERVAAFTRVATAITAADRAFAQPSPDGRTVVVVNGWRPDDIAAATLLAAQVGEAAVLYAEAGALPAETAVALRRYQPSRVVIVGGSDSLSTAVHVGIAAAVPDAVIVLEPGDDRIAATAARARRTIRSLGPAEQRSLAVVLANGSRHADVGIAAVLAAHTADAVVLLTDADALSPATEAVLRDHAPGRVFIVGGQAVVSAEVEAGVRDILPTGTPLRRLGGSDRNSTAAAVARRVLDGS